MVCCTVIAGLLALLLWPLAGWRANPLAWRPGDQGEARAVPALRGRAQSIAHALAGLGFAIRHEVNMRFHAAAAALAVLAGVWFGIDAADWRWLVVAIVLVLSAEALNTAVEQCCNAISRNYDPAIKTAKDVAAGSVLICALAAALIGLSIFIPAIFTSHQRPDPHASICGSKS